MVYNLIDLLPYDGIVQLNSLQERIRVIQLLSFFCHLTTMAIEAFLSKEYGKFDAQVSENLCQIRAYQIMQIVSESNEHAAVNLMETSKNAKQVKLKCKSLLAEYILLEQHKPSRYTREIDKPITLQELILNNGITVKFSDIEFFLTQAFFLSDYKLVGEHEISYGMDYEKLCYDLNISSKTYVRRIIHRLQRNVSKQSCQFIFKLMYDLNADQPHINLLSSLYFQDEVGRHVLSCYEATKIILQHALQTKKYIKIIVNRISEMESDSVTFILQPSSIYNNYRLESYDIVDRYEAFMVFTGIVRYKPYINELKKNYIDRFLGVGLEDIILANMAQHPQYAGVLLSDKKFNPYRFLHCKGLPETFFNYIVKSESEFLKHKNMSIKIGCHQNASDLFLLTHVRCNLHKTQINEIASLRSYSKLKSEEISNGQR